MPGVGQVLASSLPKVRKLNNFGQSHYEICSTQYADWECQKARGEFDINTRVWILFYYAAKWTLTKIVCDIISVISPPPPGHTSYPKRKLGKLFSPQLWDEEWLGRFLVSVTLRSPGLAWYPSRLKKSPCGKYPSHNEWDERTIRAPHSGKCVPSKYFFVWFSYFSNTSRCHVDTWGLSTLSVRQSLSQKVSSKIVWSRAILSDSCEDWLRSITWSWGQLIFRPLISTIRPWSPVIECGVRCVGPRRRGSGGFYCE